MESAPHLGVHSNSIRVRKSKRSKSSNSASEGNSAGSSGEVCGTCHKCGGSLRRGNTALARQCPVCGTRYHASDCGSRLALSGYTGSSDVCPKCANLCACVGGACMCHAAMIRQMRERRGSHASSASGATEPFDPTPRREPSFKSRAPIDSMVTFPPQINLTTRPGPPPLGSEMKSMASETMRSGRAASGAARDVFLDDSAVEISMWPAGLISRIADEQGVGITNEVNIEREIEHAPPAEDYWGSMSGFGSLFSSRRNDHGEGSNRMTASPSSAAGASAESARLLSGVAGSGHATDGLAKVPSSFSTREKDTWALLSDALGKSVDGLDDSEQARETIWLSDEDARHISSLFE